MARPRAKTRSQDGDASATPPIPDADVSSERMFVAIHARNAKHRRERAGWEAIMVALAEPVEK
jgi:hypothetical protein